MAPPLVISLSTTLSHNSGTENKVRFQGYLICRSDRSLRHGGIQKASFDVGHPWHAQLNVFSVRQTTENLTSNPVRKLCQVLRTEIQEFWDEAILSARGSRREEPSGRKVPVRLSSGILVRGRAPIRRRSPYGKARYSSWRRQGLSRSSSSSSSTRTSSFPLMLSRAQQVIWYCVDEVVLADIAALVVSLGLYGRTTHLVLEGWIGGGR